MESCRIRTGYSFRNSAGNLSEVIARLQEIGAIYAPITDNSSTFAYNRWNKLATKAGLKPVFGVELAVTESPEAKKPSFCNWTFLAIDDIKHVNALVELASRQFKYQPLLTYEQAINATGTIKIVGRKSNLELVRPSDDLYIGLSPSCNMGYLRKAIRDGHRFASVFDNVYCRVSDSGFYETIIGAGASTQTWPQHILSEAEYDEAMLEIGADDALLISAKANAKAVLSSCSATLKQGTLLSPPKEKTLEEMCREGAVKLGVDLDDPTYAERLRREIQLIKQKRFEDYFYIVSDLVAWSRQKMAVGPARGSSCGSLVCYLLNITTVDPIKFGLLFERFIDINRGGYRYNKNWNGFSDAPRRIS